MGLERSGEMRSIYKKKKREVWEKIVRRKPDKNYKMGNGGNGKNLE